MMRKELEVIIKDLQENVVANWSEEEKNYFYLTEWNGHHLTEFHHSFGRYIRNNYNLWEIPHTPELIDGVDHSPDHPDNLSSTITKELWKRGIPEEVK